MERGTPPMTVHKTLVLAQVMQSNTLRRLKPLPYVPSRSDFIINLPSNLERFTRTQITQMLPYSQNLDDLPVQCTKSLVHDAGIDVDLRRDA
jgi:hypothetical protein